MERVKTTIKYCKNCGQEIIGSFDFFHSNRRDGKGVISNPNKECFASGCKNPQLKELEKATLKG